MPELTLRMVDSAEAIAASLDSFLRSWAAHGELAGSIIRATTYWVHDPLTGAFGPGKFVGYRDMTFELYAAAKDKRTTGDRFDGTTSRTAIEKVLGRSFESRPELIGELRAWLASRVGDQIARVDTGKWRFIELSEVSFAPLPEEVPESATGIEGARRSIMVNAYERDPRLRARCIAHYGTRCAVCSVDLAEVYGDIGRGYIHVHHLKMLARAGGERQVDPVADLRPVCPNCHAMLHRRDPPFGIEDLRQRIRPQRSADGR